MKVFKTKVGFRNKTSFRRGIFVKQKHVDKQKPWNKKTLRSTEQSPPFSLCAFVHGASCQEKLKLTFLPVGSEGRTFTENCCCRCSNLQRKVARLNSSFSKSTFLACFCPGLHTSKRPILQINPAMEASCNANAESLSSPACFSVKDKTKTFKKKERKPVASALTRKKIRSATGVLHFSIQNS